MVSTRACSMEKNKNGVNNSGVEKTIMKTCLNPESEDDDQTTQTSVPSGSAGSSIKVTLKKTRSCSSSSSRGSAHSFEVVRSVLPASESVSGGEDGENQKDSDNDNNSNKCSDANNSGNEKESEDESQNANSYGEDEIEILSSDDDSQESSERPITADVSVKDEKTVPLHTEVDLKTEEVIPPNSLTVKNEAATVSLKDELLKESYTEGEMEVKQQYVDNGNSQVSQPLNGIELKETKEHIKEQKFKLNVRSFDDLAGPSPVDLINMPPPGQMDGGPPNYLSQNGGSFPLPFISIPCDVCGLQFDSSELLNEHKIAMKHFKCSFKECEHLLISSQHEFQEHQRMIHNIMPSPVQQLAHQVQRLPAMGFDQQLQSGGPPLPDALSSQSGVPNMYTPQLRMPNQPVPMQRSMRPSMMRPSMPQNMMSGRGRNIMRPSRGRPTIMNSNMGRGGSMKRPSTMPVRHALPPKRVTPMDRNSYTNSPNKSSPIVKSFSDTLSKSLTASANKSSTNQDVVNLFSKRGLTISTVDSGNNISLPAGLSLNSAVTIIPTSPLKVPNNVSKKVSNHVSHKVPLKSVDTVDLTGPDKPREKKYYPCEVCSKTFLSVETLYEHISTTHKSYALPFKCNLCPGTFPSFDILNRHKLSFHKSEEIPAVPYVIPILDLNKVGTVSKLQSMGVTSYIPVAQLDNQGGQFGVPIMSVSRPGSIDGLRYTSFFNLGCVRKL